MLTYLAYTDDYCGITIGAFRVGEIGIDTVDAALDLLGINMDDWAAEQHMDGWDYSALHLIPAADWEGGYCVRAHGGSGIFFGSLEGAKKVLEEYGDGYEIARRNKYDCWVTAVDWNEAEEGGPFCGCGVEEAKKK